MSILTPFFNLIKPTKTDGVKVSDFNSNMDTIDTEMHRPPLTVNDLQPDANRNIYLQTVPLADNLSSDDAQINIGTYLERTSGGQSAIEDGDASLSTIKGNMVKTGYVAEVLEMTVNAVPRVAPPAITAELDIETFEAYVESSGTYTLSYLNDEWNYDPEDYGVTITNDPVNGDEIVIVWDGENDPVMTVNAAPREVPPAITATLNKETFRAYVSQSGTVTLSYTTAWSADPALYGVTVTNDPVSGDSIVINYTKENRGTITPAAVTSFNSTGWNLYDNAAGKKYARVIKYSDDYGYKIGGNYGLITFSTTVGGTPTALLVDDGYFSVPSDGFVTVTGGDDTTYIYATWSDWVEGYEGEFEEYTDYSVSLSSIMVNFAAGLLAIGEVRDEINFNIQKAISRVQRLSYTAENLALVIASGVPYDTDTNYIYAVRETPVEYNFTVDGSFTVSDHGIEFFTATTDTPVVCETLYGQNLKDKLRRDVVTISEQTLTSTQKEQVRENIGAASDDIKAAMGVVENGNTATQAIASGDYVIWKGLTYTADAAIAVGETLKSESGTGKNLTSCPKGGFNAVYSALNGNIDNLKCKRYSVANAFTFNTGYAVNVGRYMSRQGDFASISFSIKKTDNSAFSASRHNIGSATSTFESNGAVIVPVGGNTTIGSTVNKLAGFLLIVGTSFYIDVIDSSVKEIHLSVTYDTYNP